MSDGGVNQSRRYFLAAATSVVGAAGAVAVLVPFVKSWTPSAKARAAGAPVKFDLSKLEPGQMATVEWRGKPVYALRRTPAILEGIVSLDDKLKDPDSIDALQPDYIKGPFRAIKDEFLIVVGLCTHLGCAPKYRPEVGSVTPDWRGGFFCPCHGSMFDLAGRVYKSVPAPTNLEVPSYFYETDSVIVIGLDGGAA